RPKNSPSYAYIQGIAALALDKLVEAKTDKNIAARRVAKALHKARKDMSNVLADAVLKWRERIKEGRVADISEDAIKSFHEPLPASLGEDPLTIGKNLLRIIEKRGGVKANYRGTCSLSFAERRKSRT